MHEEKLINLVQADLKKDDIEINGLNIHYVTAGSGPPLLLLHGANIGWGAWYKNIAAFAKHFTVYAIDFPGSGKSTKIHYHSSNLEKIHVDSVVEFIQRKQLHDVTIIGHSLGGWVALKIAQKNISVSKIILVSPLGLTKDIPLKFLPVAFLPAAKLLTKTAVRPTKKNMKKFLEDVMSKTSEVDPEFIEYYHNFVEQDENNHPFFLLNRLFGFPKIRKEFMIINDLHKIHCPIFIIAGDEDPLVPLSKIKKILPLFKSAQLTVFSSTGHVPPLEKSEQFNREVLQFLSKIR